MAVRLTADCRGPSCRGLSWPVVDQFGPLRGATVRLVAACRGAASRSIRAARRCEALRRGGRIEGEDSSHMLVEGGGGGRWRVMALRPAGWRARWRGTAGDGGLIISSAV